MGTETIGDAYTEDGKGNLIPVSGGPVITPPPPDHAHEDWHGYSSDDRKPIWKRLGFLIGGTVGLAALFGLSLIWTSQG